MPIRKYARSIIAVVSTSILFATTSAVTTVAAAGADPELVQLSADPFTNPTSQHATQVEPDTYASGSTVVSTWHSGRFFSGGAGSGIGWATSTDSGTTWTSGHLPGVTTFTGGRWSRATDSTVAYDAAHDTWLISSLVIDLSTLETAVLVNRSTDGGLSWDDPVTVALNPGPALDKTWIVCDDWPSSPNFGNCYAQWSNFLVGCGAHVEVSTSTDGGLTWGKLKRPANQANAIGGQPVVQPTGTVVVPILGGCSRTLSVFRSDDGGVSWSSVMPIGNVYWHAAAGPLRGADVPWPSAEVDGSGRIFLAWQDCRFRTNCASNDIVFSQSADGRRWSPVTRIPIDPASSTVDHFIPGLAVHRSTSGTTVRLGLTYYFYRQADCDEATCQLEAGFVSSVNSGRTWSTPTHLAGPMSLSWVADTSRGRMVGDYISTSFTSDGRAHPVIAVAKPAANDQFDQAMYAVVGGLTSEGGPVAVGPEDISHHGRSTGTP